MLLFCFNSIINFIIFVLFPKGSRQLSAMATTNSSSSSCSSTTTRPEDRIGHLLAGHLELTGILGIGAYGVVYTAIDIYTYMPYAVKALSKEGMDARQRRFQQREIALHHRVSAHENIVSLIKILEAPDCTYVVIEYCPEGDLFTNITERGHFVGNDLLAKQVFLQLLNAVEHCHNMGIYHRDLKPENVLVCCDGGYQVKLADFGLATTDAVTSDFGCGSTFYMSPECQQQSSSGSKNYQAGYRNCYASAPNDVWSLGVILVNLTCGRNPWKRAAPSDSTFRAYLKNPRFLRTILPLSLELDDILRSIFELDPLKRISIRDLRDKVQRCRRFTTGPGPAMCTTPPPSGVSSDCSDISTSDAHELPPQQYLPQFQTQNGAITPPSPSTPAPYPPFIFSGQLPATPPHSPPPSPVEAQKPAHFAPPPTPVSNSSPPVVVSHPQLNTPSWQVPILDQVGKLRSHYFPQNPHLVTGPQGVPCY